MFIALDSNGKRIDVADAEKSNDYFCPVCNGGLRVREGSVNIKHFSHISKTECDDFTTDMSEWHRKWQEQFPVKNREVVIEHNGEKHRADVLAYGHVIEFQHSPISLHEFERRNEFYTSAGKKVVWVFDFVEQHSSNQMECFDEWQKGSIRGGQWRWSHSKRIFKNFAPQKQKNVVLLFQVADKEQEELYLERVSWADSNWDGVSFQNFRTIYFPVTKEDLLDWIKNRDEYDAEENLILHAPVITPKKKIKPPPRAQKAVLTPPTPSATTITSKLEMDNIPIKEFHKENILMDKNGERIFLCTECHRVLYSFEMSDYRYAKGVCRTCMRKKESFSP